MLIRQTDAEIGCCGGEQRTEADPSTRAFGPCSGQAAEADGRKPILTGYEPDTLGTVGTGLSEIPRRSDGAFVTVKRSAFFREDLQEGSFGNVELRNIGYNR